MHEVNYDQTFSLVIRYESLRVVFDIASQHDMQMIQFDIYTTFLDGKMDIELYMVQPLDFKIKQFLYLVCLIFPELIRLQIVRANLEQDV